MQCNFDIHVFILHSATYNLQLKTDDPILSKNKGMHHSI